MSAKNSILVLTANIDSYSRLRPPAYVSDDCDYIVASAGDWTGAQEWYRNLGWTLVNNIPFSGLDIFECRRNAKIYKILSTIMFPNYEYIIWHDAAATLISDPKLFIEKHKDFDILIGRHGTRACAYDEIDTVKKLSYDFPETMDAQKEFYKKNNMPRNFGLWLGSSYIAKNTQATKELQLMWWELVCKFSSRDQCSFPYCVYKMGDRINLKSARCSGTLVSKNTPPISRGKRNIFQRT